MSERLVERARHGDEDAFVALIADREDTMTRVAGAILHEPADVADALQEAVLSIWRELPRLRSVDAFAAWSDRVVVNACRLVLRRRSRRRLREIALSSEGEEGTHETKISRPAPFDEAIADRDSFDRAFDGLEVDDRAILVLHHLEARSVADIARTFEIPVGTAKSRLFHARRRLAAALDAQAADEAALEAQPGRAASPTHDPRSR